MERRALAAMSVDAWALRETLLHRVSAIAWCLHGFVFVTSCEGIEPSCDSLRHASGSGVCA
jgi:hypothetical protein